MQGDRAGARCEGREILAVRTIAVGCPLCDSRESWNLKSGLRDVENSVPGEYAISKCRSCGVIYLSVRPDDESLARCYDGSYHVRSKRMRNRVLRFLVDLRYPMRYRRLEKYLRREPGSILEIGCGDGRFLLFLDRKLKGRCRLVGLDLDVKNVDLNRNSKIEIIQGSIDDIELNDRFDMVIMYDVLEHLPHPVEALRKARNCLKHDGILVIKAPNWNSLWRAVFPRHWGGLQVPRHQLFFDPGSLGKLCGMAGLRVERMVNVFDPGDLSVSVCNWITDTFSLRTPPRRAWFYMPMALVCAPIVFLQKWLLMQAGEIECVCSCGR